MKEQHRVRKPMIYLRRIGINCFNVLRESFVRAAARGMKEELARRDGERGGHNLRWFTPDEAVMAEALARVIVPSDEETPGIEEVDVFGPPATVALDHLVAASPYRQYLYAWGLLSFDIWARKKYGCKFAEMTKEDQIGLIMAAQQIQESMAAEASKLARAWRKFRISLFEGYGSLFAADLYPQIRNDCLQVFYTSRVSWVWLEYDGPPMDKGYPSVVEPR